MPRLVRHVETSTPTKPRTLAPCFRCRHDDRITPATHIVFYDEAVGAFAEREEPRLCQGHVEGLSDLSVERRKEFYRGFPIRPVPPEPVPCRPFPENATYKTVGLGPCPKCDSLDCWNFYLAWEKQAGITFNASEHPPD